MLKAGEGLANHGSFECKVVTQGQMKITHMNIHIQLKDAQHQDEVPYLEVNGEGRSESESILEYFTLLG
ncbi:hypothetical protein L2E82_03770 [Cichorium intybus]|uniref:Uncharacterized protein n=1 Tax=Cichorium intybus TaxID=13427 RepID=A0ACB9H4D6_CICIN|nr:hypothetical protein L2E82_03770 [Cichorium intybus]